MSLSCPYLPVEIADSHAVEPSVLGRRYEKIVESLSRINPNNRVSGLPASRACREDHQKRGAKRRRKSLATCGGFVVRSFAAGPAANCKREIALGGRGGFAEVSGAGWRACGGRSGAGGREDAVCCIAASCKDPPGATALPLRRGPRTGPLRSQNRGHCVHRCSHEHPEQEADHCGHHDREQAKDECLLATDDLVDDQNAGHRERRPCQEECQGRAFSHP